MARTTFEAIGGYSEFMRGWGFEDTDLRARLAIQAGVALHSIPDAAIGLTRHSYEDRMGPAGGRWGGGGTQRLPRPGGDAGLPPRQPPHGRPLSLAAPHIGIAVHRDRSAPLAGCSCHGAAAGQRGLDEIENSRRRTF